MKKENTKKFTLSLFALVLGLVIISVVNHVLAATGSGPAFSYPDCPSTEPGCSAPVNVGKTMQVKDGSLGVNAFIANQNSEFKQSVLFDTLASVNLGSSKVALIGGADRQTCVDPLGTLKVCDTPDTILDSSKGGPLSTYSGSGFSYCPSDNNGWWHGLGNVTVTNDTDIAKNYIIVASVSVANDTNADYPILMLKEGNVNSYIHYNVIAFKQEVIDGSDYWKNNPKARPGLIQITSLYNIPAHTTKNFNTWTTEAIGGCYNIIGDDLQVSPL